MLLAGLYFDDLQNSVADAKSGGAQSFFAENRGVWTDPAKNAHKIKYVERVEIYVSLVRLKLNTISTLPVLKTLMVFTY
jgi:hypothetical protein